MALMLAPGGRMAISPTARLPSSRRNHSMWVTAKPGRITSITRWPKAWASRYSGPLTSRGSRHTH